MNLVHAAAALAVLGVVSVPRPAALVAPVGRRSTEQHFSLVLERTDRGWAAQCDSGCAWTKLTMACLGCTVRVTDQGVGPAVLRGPHADRFAFTVRGAGLGWAATGQRGVRWKALRWKCGGGACRARIDETGVTGLSPTRR